MPVGRDDDVEVFGNYFVSAFVCSREVNNSMCNYMYDPTYQIFYTMLDREMGGHPISINNMLL